MGNSGKKILIADDVSDAREVMRAILESMDFDILEAETGLAAVNLIESDPAIVLALLDINMPLIDGLRVLERIAPLKKQRGFKVCLVTGQRSEQDVKAGIAVGCDDYIVKPIDTKVLIRKVENLLGTNSNVNDFFKVPVKMKATLANTKPSVPLTILSLSEIGAGVESSAAFEIGKMIALSSEDFGKVIENKFPINCKVLSSTPSGDKFLVEVQFVGIEAKTSQLLRSFVIRNPNPKKESA